MNHEPSDAKSIFGRAIEIHSPSQRGGYLEEACHGRADLRAEVEDLLRAFAGAGDFMEGPVLETATQDHNPQIEEAGAAIGPYKLLQQIGEGGFGVVYMAEQLEPVRRRVALKIIKPGMDTKEVIARFEAEEQALALMDHSNIARVFDAGTTQSGRPYFVMELVKGVPISDYCDRSNLTTRERLNLFVHVCQAVHHAHQKGVIHRDIKPSNVLVTLHDGTPVVKVIDFGVAKAINQRLTERTLCTSFGQMIGTPMYMSPEQAEFSGLDVDTRTDVYALGVLLYELLTGTTPFEKQRLNAAAFDEVRRIIREEEPPRPSTKISTLGETATTICAHRKTDPKRLSAIVRGDLDWIVMKTLEKDRTRRYDTAKELAADVQRHLNHEPVDASPPSIVYRLRKFLHRNRAAARIAGAAVGLLAILAIAGGIVLWQYYVEAQKVAARKSLPGIRELILSGQTAAAVRPLEEAGKWIPGDPMLEELWGQACLKASVRTDPAGAQAAVKDWRSPDSDWIPLGVTPLENARIPRGPLRWRLSKAGFAPVECLNVVNDGGDFQIALDPDSKVPPEMTHVRKPDAGLDFYMDIYEVTNRRYKKFVDAKGYADREFWADLIEQVGKDKWSSSLEAFVDKTGKPGPAGWSNGEYPSEQADYPVTGVSWYEAAAYARFAKKQLPAVAEWECAADFKSTTYVVPLSNFSGRGVDPAGKNSGIGCFGVYDAAGNVKEWCFNARSDGTRTVLGGDFNDQPYMFGAGEGFLPGMRAATIGFRCVFCPAPRNPEILATVSSPPPPPKPVPLTPEELAAAKKIFAYNRSAKLNETVVQEPNSSDEYVHERIEVDAAYGGRLTLHLFLPKGMAMPPYHTIVYFPGNGARQFERFSDGIEKGDFTVMLPFVRQGRAVCWPIYTGTFERNGAWREGGSDSQERAFHVRMVQDLGRAVDYLETRKEIRKETLTYVGLSWGAALGPLMVAADGRFAACVLYVGGLSGHTLREINPSAYADHVHIPVLMLNGRNDSVFPLESHQKPLFEALGTKDRVHKIFDGGHGIPLDVAHSFMQGWLREKVGAVELVNLTDPMTWPVAERGAKSRMENGLLDMAEGTLQQLLKRRQTHLGENHRDSLRTRYLIADLRGRQKRTAESIAMYEAVLDDQRRHLGEGDADTRTTRISLANFCGVSAVEMSVDPAKPDTHYARAVELAEKALRLDSSGDGRRFHLAAARHSRGDLKGALASLEESARRDWGGGWQCLLFALVQGKLNNLALAEDWYAVGRDWIARDNIGWKPILDLRDEARQLLATRSATPVSIATYERLVATCPQGSLTAALHRTQQHWDKAEADLSMALKLAPDAAYLYVTRGDLRISLARWTEAEADFTKAIELAPDDHWNRFRLAPLRLFLGNEAGYRDLCRRMLERWGNDRDPYVLERTARVCSILPGTDEDARLSIALAERAVRAQPDRSWNVLAKGITDYRGASYVSAVEGLTGLTRATASKWPGGDSLDAHAHLFLALAQHQRRQLPQAADSLATARAFIFAETFGAGRGQFSDTWNDWLIAFVVYPEAVQLVEGGSKEAAKAELQTLLRADAPTAFAFVAKALDRVADEEVQVQLWTRMGLTLAAQGKLFEARDALGRALKLSEGRLARGCNTACALSWVASQLRDWEAAETIQRQFIRTGEPGLGKYNGGVFQLRSLLPWVLQEQGKAKDAESVRLELCADVESRMKTKSGIWGEVRDRLLQADLLSMTRNDAASLQEALRILKDQANPDDWLSSCWHRVCSETRDKLGERQEAIRHARLSLEKTPDVDLFSQHLVQQHLIRLLRGAGQFQDVEAVLRKSLAGKKETGKFGDDHVITNYARADLAEFLVERKKYAEAESLLQQAQKALLADPRVPALQRQRVAGALAKLYEAWGKPEQASLWRTKRDGVSTSAPSASATKGPDGK